MAVRLVINADVNGQQRVNRLTRSIRGAGTAGDGLGRTLRNIRNLVIGAFAIRGIIAFGRQITNAGDVLIGIENQLRAGGIAVENINMALNDTRNIANETRSSLEATGQLYARILRSTRDLGLSSQEALDITRAFQQTLALSGATTSEAAAASLQFGQGLAAGRLQGDELRSILENNSFFARELASELGVGVGALREMGAQGELTSDLLADISLRIAPRINEQFEQLTPTFGQAFTVLSNGFVDALADVSVLIQDSTGLNDSLLNAGNTLTSIFGAEGNGFADIIPNIIGAFGSAFDMISFTELNTRFFDAINTAIDAGFAALSNIDFAGLLMGFVDFFDDIDWFVVLANITGFLANVGYEIVKFLLQVDWLSVLISLTRFFVAIPKDLIVGFLGIDWVMVLRSLADAIGDIARNFGSSILSAVTDNRVTRFFGNAGSSISSGFNRINPFGNKDGGLIGYQNGGQVTGPGGPRSDSILAALSNGEFVINARSTEQFLPLLEAINGGSGDGVGQAFQNGGLVGGNSGNGGGLFGPNFGRMLGRTISESFVEGLAAGDLSGVFTSILDTVTSNILSTFTDNLSDVLGSLFSGSPIGGGGLLSSLFGGIFHEGGIVPGSPGQSVPIIAQAGERVIPASQVGNTSTQEFNINVTGDVSRQTRTTIAAMIPEIASGVNATNREMG